MSAQKGDRGPNAGSGVAALRRPGPRDTTAALQAGRRALPSKHCRHQHRRGRCWLILSPGRRFRPPRAYWAMTMPEMLSPPTIWARKTAASGMQHPGVAARRRPGPGDTTWAHPAGGRGLPGEITRQRHRNMAGHNTVSAIQLCGHCFRIEPWTCRDAIYIAHPHL